MSPRNLQRGGPIPGVVLLHRGVKSRIPSVLFLLGKRNGQDRGVLSEGVEGLWIARRPHPSRCPHGNLHLGAQHLTLVPVLLWNTCLWTWFTDSPAGISPFRLGWQRNAKQEAMILRPPSGSKWSGNNCRTRRDISFFDISCKKWQTQFVVLGEDLFRMWRRVECSWHCKKNLANAGLHDVEVVAFCC